MRSKFPPSLHLLLILLSDYIANMFLMSFTWGVTFASPQRRQHFFPAPWRIPFQPPPGTVAQSWGASALYADYFAAEAIRFMNLLPASLLLPAACCSLSN